MSSNHSKLLSPDGLWNEKPAGLWGLKTSKSCVQTAASMHISDMVLSHLFCIGAYFLKYTNILFYWFSKLTQKPNISSEKVSWWHAFPSPSACMDVWTNEMQKKEPEREREGVPTGRKRGKVQAAYVSGSTSPLRSVKDVTLSPFPAAWARSTSVEVVIFSQGCYFHNEHGTF